MIRCTTCGNEYSSDEQLIEHLINYLGPEKARQDLHLFREEIPNISFRNEEDS